MPAKEPAARSTAGLNDQAPARPSKPSFGGITGTRSGGGGSALPNAVERPISASLGVDVSPIRVHQGGAAATRAADEGAHAFALGRDIVLGASARANDLPLMAHEVTHVIQQRHAPTVQLWSSTGLGRYEEEARQASMAVTRGQRYHVRERTSPAAQRLTLQPRLSRPNARLTLDYDRHTSGAKIDAALAASKFFGPFVQDALKAGTKTAGHIHVYDDKTYLKKAVAYQLASGATKEEAVIEAERSNGFQDGTEIHVSKDRGDGGTTPHEAIHLFAHSSWVPKVGRAEGGRCPANEGVTEYFTRMLCNEMDVARLPVYAKEYDSTDKLAWVMGGYANGNACSQPRSSTASSPSWKPLSTSRAETRVKERSPSGSTR
jgi:hypothetical protein